MLATKTVIDDVIDPEVFNPYVIERTAKLDLRILSKWNHCPDIPNLNALPGPVANFDQYAVLGRP